MKVALIGYPSSGKSTLYRAAARGLAKGSVTSVPVPDARFDAIVAQVKPKKQTPATVVLDDDLDALSSSGSALSQRLVDGAKRADVLLHVVRGFNSPVVPYHAEVDPIRDQEGVDVELVLADLQIVENRLERLLKSASVKTSGSPDYLEKQALERIHGPLESGTPVRDLDLTEDELNVVNYHRFLSAKSMVIAFNLDESAVATPPARIAAQCATLAKAGTPAFVVCASTEEEIAQLDPADQPEFLASIGVDESASDKLVRAVYDSMGLITFFTAGENDTHAWPLRKGSSALKAAATIHTDIAKGFIRAEIVHYDDYTAAGSLDAAYSAGKMSLEGKEYVIRDGDLLHIRNKS